MSFNVPSACGIQSIASATCVLTGGDSDSSTRYNWFNVNKNHQQARTILYIQHLVTTGLTGKSSSTP